MRKSACFCIVTATYYWMLIMLGIVLMALYALFHLIFITPWSKYYYHLHLQIMKLRVRKFNSPEVLWLVRGELDLTPGEISCALHHAVLHFTAQLVPLCSDIVQLSVYFPYTLSSWCSSGWTPACPRYGMDSQPTPGYILSTDNLNGKRLLFFPMNSILLAWLWGTCLPWHLSL